MKHLLICILNMSLFYSSNAQTSNSKFHYDDSLKISYKANLVFQYGGESKVTVIPKFNAVRIHQKKLIKPFYGVELGIHPLFVAGAFTLSGIAGAELYQFKLESSISHFRTTKISDGDGGYNGPFNQSAINLKLGYSIKKITVKVGTSFVIDESIPDGSERIPLLDIGMINGQIFGIELQIRIN